MSDTRVDAAPKRRTPTWLVATIAGLFGLFYAYAVWNALGNLIEAARLPTGMNGLGWSIWIFAVLFPILVFAVALTFGHRRPALHLFLLLLTGIALVAVVWLDIVAYTTLYTASLLG